MYVCFIMTCTCLCDIWFRMTHEVYGDLGIKSRQYTSRDKVWQLSLLCDELLINLWDDRVRSDYKEVLILSLVIWANDICVHEEMWRQFRWIISDKFLPGSVCSCGASSLFIMMLQSSKASTRSEEIIEE